MAIMKGINARIYACNNVAASTTFTGEAMVANATRTRFTIVSPTKRFWDPSATTVVKLGGTPITTYSSIQYPGGRVNFAADPGAGALTVDGKYFAVAAFIQCKSWELNAEFDYYEATCFGDGMRVQMPAMRSATVSLGAFHIQPSGAPDPADDRFLYLVNQNTIGLDLFMDATASSEKRYTCYGHLQQVTTNAASDNLIEQPLTFFIDDGPYYVGGLGAA